MKTRAARGYCRIHACLMGAFGLSQKSVVVFDAQRSNTNQALVVALGMH
jgi:hypothetical protein